MRPPNHHKEPSNTRKVIREMSPAKFETRPLRFEDVERYAETASAIAAHIGADDLYQPKSILVEWREPNFDLASSSLGIFTNDGVLVGYGIIWATAEKPVHPWIDWGVHPDYHQDYDLGDRLLHWADGKSDEIIPRCPPEARISMWSGTYQGYAFAEETLERAGYSARRISYEMRISLSQRPVPPAFPAGISLRPYHHEEDLPLLVDAVRNSFSDHFGYIEETFEKDMAEFRHWLNNDPFFDPRLVILAVDEGTGVVAGCLLGLTQEHRNPNMGYIDLVGVRREYRRRGLAGAMLQHSFATYWDMGQKTVCLGVDGESLTNAVALYERVGMRIHRRFMAYEKLLREGVELAKVALE